MQAATIRWIRILTLTFASLENFSCCRVRTRQPCRPGAPESTGGSRLSLRRNAGPVAFRHFLRGPMEVASRPGRRLALRTKMGAASGDHDPADFRAAAAAGLPL